MGLNNENANRVVFDIETASLEDAIEYLEPSEAPSNYKDAAKIAAYVAEKNAEQLDKCSLDADLCRIVAIGVQAEGMESPLVLRSDDEAAMLAVFWRHVVDRHLIGYNCLGFDLPVLFRRSLYLGVPAPHIQIDRFKHPQVTDLMDELSYGGKLRLRGLSFFCRRFGIDIADDLKGADIAQAVLEQRWEDIERHVSADVQKTAALAARLGHFRLMEAAVI